MMPKGQERERVKVIFLIDFGGCICGTLERVSARLPKRELPLALLLIAQAGLVVLLGCAHHETNSSPRGGAQNTAARAAEAIEAVRKRLAPDPHLNVFDISAEERNHELVLTGETSDARIVAELVSILK